jgi:hypothetical protein
MEIICSGHSTIPYIDGRKYTEMCFVCLHIPKIWDITEGKAEDGSEDVWEGPFYDHKHLFTAQELIKEGVTDDLRQAKKSLTAVKKRITAAKKCGRI